MNRIIVAVAGLCAVGAVSTATANADPESTIPGDGTYVVGIDVLPGVYVSANSDGCYWERLSGRVRTTKNVIASSSSTSQQYVQIGPSDIAFFTQGCVAWSPLGAEPVSLTVRGHMRF